MNVIQIDLDKINDIDYILENIVNISKLSKALKDAVKLIWDKVKYDKENLVGTGWHIEYSSYTKYVADDINAIILKYPPILYPTMYNISLSAVASSEIKDESLLKEKEILVAKIKIDA